MIESIWKDAVQLWLNIFASAFHIYGLERDMEYLKMDNEDINDAMEGGYLSRELNEAKNKDISCKEYLVYGGSSCSIKYREENNGIYWYNYNYVHMFDSIEII